MRLRKAGSVIAHVAHGLSLAHIATGFMPASMITPRLRTEFISCAIGSKGHSNPASPLARWSTRRVRCTLNGGARGATMSEDAHCLVSVAGAVAQITPVEKLLQAPEVLLDLGRIFASFLQREAEDPKLALQHFKQSEIDRWTSPEFFVLIPIYVLMMLEPRSPRSIAVRSSWATCGFYGAIFGMLGGQFGLYFFDLFQARCIAGEASKRPRLTVWHSVLICMLAGAPFAYVSNKLTSLAQEGRVATSSENSEVFMYPYCISLILVTTCISIAFLS